MSGRATLDRTAMVASVAPEDLSRGDFVAVLNQVVEYPSFFWSDSFITAREKVVRFQAFSESGGTVLKIKAICLPFVFVRSSFGDLMTVDVRQVQLVRLRKRYAKTVWRAHRRKRTRTKREG